NWFEHDRTARVLRRRHRTIPLNPPRPNDAGVINILRVNQRAPPRLPAPLPANIYHRIIIRIAAANDHAVRLQPNDGPIAHLHTTDQITPCRHNHLTTAADCARIKRLLERNSVLVRAVTDRAEIAHVENPIRRSVPSTST